VVKRLTHERWRPSLRTAARLVRALAVARPLLDKTLVAELARTLDPPALVERTLAGMTDDEVKTVDRGRVELLARDATSLLLARDATSLLLARDATSLLAGAPEAQTLAEAAERCSLAWKLRLLKCGVLAKQLEAAQQLEARLSLLSLPRPTDAGGAEPAPPGAAMLAWAPAAAPRPPDRALPLVSAEWMVRWLDGHKALDAFLSNDPHEQLIRRCPAILAFLAARGALSSHHLDLVWNAGLGKADSVARVVSGTLADLAPTLGPVHVRGLLARQAQKRPEELRDYDLALCRALSLRAVHLGAAADGATGRGIATLWGVLTGGNANVEAVEAAGAVLEELLAQPALSADLALYCRRCVERLARGPSASALPVLRLAPRLFRLGLPSSMGSEGGERSAPGPDDKGRDPAPDDKGGDPSAGARPAGLTGADAKATVAASPTRAGASDGQAPSAAGSPGKRRGLAETLEALDREHGLLGVLLRDLERYLAEARATTALATGPATRAPDKAEAPPEGDAGVGGPHHSTQLATRLELVELVLSGSRLRLDDGRLTALWSAFVCEADRAHLFAWYVTPTHASRSPCSEGTSGPCG
jgi:hypothetical protein